MAAESVPAPLQTCAILGDCGSGKTAALVARAVELAGADTGKVRVLCAGYEHVDRFRGMLRPALEAAGLARDAVELYSVRRFAYTLLGTADAKAFTGCLPRVPTAAEEALLRADAADEAAYARALAEFGMMDDARLPQLAVEFLQHAMAETGAVPLAAEHVLVDDYEALSATSQKLVGMTAFRSLTATINPTIHSGLADPDPCFEGAAAFAAGAQQVVQLEPPAPLACENVSVADLPAILAAAIADGLKPEAIAVISPDAAGAATLSAAFAAAAVPLADPWPAPALTLGASASFALAAFGITVEPQNALAARTWEAQGGTSALAAIIAEATAGLEGLEFLDALCAAACGPAAPEAFALLAPLACVGCDEHAPKMYRCMRRSLSVPAAAGRGGVRLGVLDALFATAPELLVASAAALAAPDDRLRRLMGCARRVIAVADVTPR